MEAGHISCLGSSNPRASNVARITKINMLEVYIKHVGHKNNEAQSTSNAYSVLEKQDLQNTIL